MRTFGFLLSLVFLHSLLIAQEPPSALGNKIPNPPKRGPVVVHKIQYTGTLSEKKASFLATLSLECTNKVETVLPLLTGDIAVTGSKLPEGLRLERSGKGYLLSVNKPGEYEVELNILAKITKADPWSKVEFTGPAATIGSVNAEVAGNGMELELLSGTPKPHANGKKSKVSGALGADRKVSLRWQTKVTRQERPSLLTVQTISTVQVTPTIIKYSSVYNYNILQGKPTNVVLRLPASQTLTSVKSGAPVRDRRIETLNGQQVLTIDFVKPLEKKYNLTLLTEQPRSVAQATAGLEPPEPKGVQRERGQVNLQAQDMKVEPGKLAGLRQVNAAANTVGVWQFFGRKPFQLEVGMQRIEPVLSANDIVQVVLEEKMLKIIHALTLNVEKAGIYTVELTPQAGLMVSDVVGTGISDWEEKGDKITLEFSARVLGPRQMTVVLEEMSEELPAQLKIAPLVVTGAVRQTAQIAVTPVRGLELKTDDNGTNGLRETPANIGLTFSAADSDWNLAIAPRKLPPRLIAQVSNGVVIGENRVYGFAKIFYAISDQGVQQFHVRVPAEWENIQFLGTRKRRELKFADNNASKTRDYTLTLQDEVWDQYTLQVTYDLPLGENLSLGGAHPMQAGEDGLEELERNTGTIVIHSAANIKLEKPETDLNQIDPSELDKHERGRITHPILYAYKYDGEPFNLKVAVGRYKEQALLNSVADYAELTTVVTGNGQVATTALLSVKKTDKDNPSFKLPEGGEFISCRIDGTTVTPGKENDNFIIPLPEDASRNQVFEVQISYSEKHDKFKHDGMLAKMQTDSLKLSGPVTLNIPNTYSRWTVYVPNTHELYGFEGNMVAPRKKQYTLATAWARFGNFLRRTNWAGPILTGFIMIGLLVILIVYLSRGPRKALITTGVIAGIMVLGGVGIALSMGGMAAAKYAATDAEYAPQSSPAESVSLLYATGEAEGERLSRNSIYLTEGRFEDKDEAGAEEESQPSDPASKTESPKKKSPKPDANKESPPGNSPTRPTPVKPGQDGLSKGIPGGVGGMGGGGFGPVSGGKTSGSSGNTRASGKEGDSGRVTGVLPPEFNLPTDGRAYVFTKALNLAGKDENERLRIDANIMDWNSHRTRTGIFQWLIALAGLIVLVREFRREECDSRWITAGLAMILGGVGAFMCSQSTLHLLFINALWILALAIYAWAAWYFWPTQRYSPPPPDDKGDGGSSDEPDQPAEGSAGTSATAATATLLLLLSLNTALAAGPIPPPPPRDARAWEGLENLLRLLADPDVLLQKPGGPKVIREAQLQDRNGTWFEINQEKPFTGKVLGFFQNRQKRIESDYQEGLLHGVQTLWFDNGQKRQLTQHEKGLQHGVQTTWYRGGQKASKSNYQKGKRHGSHRIWHLNGTLAGETSYLHGETNGLARQWHDNGKIAREVRWEMGRQLAFDTWTAKGVRFGEGTNTVSMVSASYKLNIHSEVAQVEAEFKLSARLAKQKFTLFREIIAVDEFSSSQAGAKLLREGPALVLYLPEVGESTVKMKFLTRHAGDATKRTLGFGIPSSLTSKVDVVLQEDDSEVEMPTAVTYTASSGGSETLVEAVIGASDRLELTWKPRIKKAKEIAATVFVQNASTISFGNGVVQTRTVLDYTVSQGELGEVKAVLPEGWKLMKVDGGKTMRTYFVNTEESQSVLTVQLEKGVSTVYQLVLELEQTLAAPPTTVKLSLPSALGVKRETGFIALQSGEELGLTVSELEGLLQVDGAEFTRNTKQKIQAGATSYGYNNPDYTLSAEVEAILPEIEATARHLTAISEEQLRVTTHIDYLIKHVGVFEFRLRLPADMRVERVTGSNNPQWEEKTIDGVRLLLVTLKQRTKGTYQLRIELVQPVDALPKEVPALGVHPLDVNKLTNLVGIYAEEGVVVEELTEGKSDNLTEMSAARFGSVTAASNNAPNQGVATLSIPSNSNALAYRHLDESPGEEPGWNVTISTKALEPWVRNAQLVNWIKLGNTRLTGRTRVRYEIERAPARRFTLILPATINTNLVKFEGANIRSHESRPTDLGNLYTITLQDKVRPGQVYMLNIDWELSEWDVDKNGTLEFQGPVTQGKNLPTPLQARFTNAGMDPMVEGEEGWLVVSDESRTQLMISTGTTLQGLEKKNTGDLPEWAKDGSESARLVYYYFRPGYQLDLNVKRLKDAAVEPAWINQANFTSVVTEDGQMMTRMAIEINNHGKQFLGIILPGEEAQIRSVFVNGQARRPTQQGEQFLVPLENSSELGAFQVEVTYTSRVDFPRMSGRVELPTPRFDVKLNNAHWWLYLPRDYAYSSFEGSMDRTDSQAIARRVSKLDTNKDGRLDQEEMGKDMQLGEILNNEDDLTLDLAKANQNNPRSGAVYGYAFKYYKQQEMGNTKRVIDNITRQQAIVESNFNKDNLSAVNRYNSQSINSINQLSGSLRGQSDGKYNEKLKNLQDNQRKLESQRRDLQVQQEQFAQQEFAFRNAFKPQQWGGQSAGTLIVSGGQMSALGRTALLVADTETVERQKRQIDEIDRIQKRVTTGEVTPLNINLPREGVFLAFSQPLQTETDKSMTISFEAENTRRTNWWVVLVWSALGISILFFLVQAIRHFALRKPVSA